MWCGIRGNTASGGFPDLRARSPYTRRARTRSVARAASLLALCLTLTACARKDLTGGPHVTREVEVVQCDSPPTTVELQVRINEAMFANESFPDDRGAYPAWIELYNPTDSEVNMGRTYLSDDFADLERQWFFPCVPATVIPPHGYLIVYLDGDRDDPNDLHASILPLPGAALMLVLNGGSDIVSLGADAFVPDRAVGRFPDGQGSFAPLLAPTPGAANAQAATPPDVAINEVMLVNRSTAIGEEEGFPAWVEFFNRGDTAADLGNAGLSDDPAQPFKWRFPAPAVIPPGGFLVVLLDGDPAGGGGLHAGFVPDAGGAVTLLLDRNVDSVVIAAGVAQADTAVGCHPDGAGMLRTLVRPTPGTANAEPALPPEAHFVRGDANADGRIDIADAVFALDFLFAHGTEPTCLDGADANDDGRLNLSDATLLLRRVFSAGRPLPSPAACGADPTDDTLRCERFAPCL